MTFLTDGFWFESSVNSYGGQTCFENGWSRSSFESSVNSYGGQTPLERKCD